MASQSAFTKITQMINGLSYECFRENMPITIYCLGKKSGKNEEIKSVISPAAVDFEGDTQTFYDIQNVLSGNFTTVPKRSSEEEEDPFEYR